MNIPDYFFLIFFVTIAATRLFLYFKPTASPTIKGFRLHHYMYGIFLVVVGVLAANIWICAVGLGLFVDELAYILIKGKIHNDYFSVKSLAGTVLFALVVFIFRDEIVSLFTVPTAAFPYIFIRKW